MELTNTQRSYLRKLAHPLNPTVMIGKQGLSGALLAKLEQELDAHELIKVRFLEFKDERRELTEQILAETHAVLVSLVGHVAVLYREQHDRDRRKILLPAG